jgi:lysophospholipase L1-like esterase
MIWLGLLPSRSAAETSEASAFGRLFLIGDSTMSDKQLDPPNPERGWGQLLPIYLREPGQIRSHASNGKSTKSFIDLGLWEAVRAELRPGDWVIIQFGTNDKNSNSPKRYADPAVAFPENLRRFVREARDAGARPILATPIVQRRFDDAGVQLDTHGEYPAAMRRVAEAENVPLLELYDLTRQLVGAYGPERSKALFLWIEPGEYASRPDGVRDDTHLSAVGASRVAELVAAEFRRLKLPLAEALR